MGQRNQIPTPPSTRQERLEAALCHLLSIPFPYAAPVVVIALRRNTSPFVSLHAAASLLETLIVNIVLIIGLGISLCFTIANIWQLVESRGGSFSWDLVWQGLLKAALTWIVLGLVSVYYTVMTLIDAATALRGEFRGGFIAKRLARRAAAKADARSRALEP